MSDTEATSLTARGLIALRRLGRRARAEVLSFGPRQWLLLAWVVPLAFLTGTAISDGLRLRGHAWPGVAVGADPVAGYSAEALTEWLSERAEELGEHPFQIQVRDKTFGVSAAEIGLQLDVAATRAAALNVGSGEALPGRLWTRLRHGFGAEISVNPEFSLDPTKFEEISERWEQQALTLPVEGSLELKGKKFAAQMPVPGGVLARAALSELLIDAVLAEQRAPIVAPISEVQPKLTQEAVTAALNRAGTLTRRTLRLQHPADPERGVSWSRSSLREALRATLIPGEPAELGLGFDEKSLEAAIQKARAGVELAPKNATFEVNRKGEITILPSQTGTKIDQAQLPGILLELAEGEQETALLPMLSEVSPALTTAEAEAQNIKDLVGTFTTGHPCCRPRVKNIHRIAELMDGVLVRAGETFSVNQHVGPRTATNGFFPAPTIVRGVIEDTVGGGVSQFATTIFNAVLRGGYEVVERQPHSYYFKRYPAGHEATLSFPKPDFIFRNDTKNGVLIKTEYGATFIRVKLYGENEGRSVKNSRSKHYDHVSPKIVYEANDELPVTEEKILERGQRGFKVAVSRVVTYANGEKKEAKRVVTYKPRDRVIEVHSCHIPEGEEGHTGEECPEPECDPEEEECALSLPEQASALPSCAPDDKECLIENSRNWKPPGSEEHPADE